jgi:hypothetical protein
VVDEEVAATHGLGGVAVKAAYAAVRRIDRGVVPRAVDEMLPDFAHVLDGFWTGRADDFAAHLVSRGDEVAEALLSVTDAQSHHGHHAALAVVYRTLRGHAAGHVRAALPRLGGAVASLVEGAGGPAPRAGGATPG